MYKARKGRGAFCNDERITVSDVKGNTFRFLCNKTQKFICIIKENNKKKLHNTNLQCSALKS